MPEHSNSGAVLAALGTAKGVDAARGRRGTDAIVVADDRVIVVSVGFFAEMGNAWRAHSAVLLDGPTSSLTLSSGRGLLILSTPTARFEIRDVHDRAPTRPLQAFVTPADFTPGGEAASSPGPAVADWRSAEQLAVRHVQQIGYDDAAA